MLWPLYAISRKTVLAKFISRRSAPFNDLPHCFFLLSGIYDIIGSNKQFYLFILLVSFMSLSFLHTILSSSIVLLFQPHPPFPSHLLFCPLLLSLSPCSLCLAALLWSNLHPGTWLQIITPEKKKELSFYLQPQLQFIVNCWMTETD